MKVTKSLVVSLIIFISLFSVFSNSSAMAISSRECNDQKQKNSFFGLPVWYKYLPYKAYNDDINNVHECRVKINVQQNPEQLALIGFGIIDILLRLTALVAFGYLVYGGIQYLISQGEPDRTKSAKSTIINAIIGVAVTIVAASVVTFVAGRIA